MTTFSTSTFTTARLDQLPTVTLAELTASAALLTRVDRKYVLTTSDLDRAWHHLPQYTRALEIDGSRSVGYISTYLDTPDLTSYLDAAHRRRRRWKVRTRSYQDRRPLPGGQDRSRRDHGEGTHSLARHDAAGHRGA